MKKKIIVGSTALALLFTGAGAVATPIAHADGNDDTTQTYRDWWANVPCGISVGPIMLRNGMMTPFPGIRIHCCEGQPCPLQRGGQ